MDAPRQQPAGWNSGGRALVVAAHPDDETIGAGGAIALHVDAGDEVTVAVVTDGGASRAGGLDEEEMARRRRGEVEAAVAELGAQRLVCLGLPEGRWSKADAAGVLAPLVAEADVVYAPTCVDFHPEHVAVARVVAGLVGGGQRVRAYELGVALTPILANHVADIRPVASRVRRAAAAHRTQALGLAPHVRLARYRARLYGVEAAEVFWELPGRAYARAMEVGDWRPGSSPYRGVRGRPFTDPLVSVVGLRERLALRRAAGAVTG